MQDVDCLPKSDHVHGSIGVSVKIRDDLKDTGAKPGQRFRVAILKPDLSLIEGKTDTVLDLFRETPSGRPGSTRPTEQPRLPFIHRRIWCFRHRNSRKTFRADDDNRWRRRHYLTMMNEMDTRASSVSRSIAFASSPPGRARSPAPSPAAEPRTPHPRRREREIWARMGGICSWAWAWPWTSSRTRVSAWDRLPSRTLNIGPRGAGGQYSGARMGVIRAH